MVPDDYHEFFIGSITVAGALIGLLFVAISVRPGHLADTGHVANRVRATSALLAFLDALFVSLVALKPGGSIGGTALGAGLAGAVSMLTLLVAVLRDGRKAGWWQFLNMLVLIGGQGYVYVLQAISGGRLLAGHHVVAQISLQATLMIAFFGFGVFRAWEYVGGPRTGLWGTVDVVRQTLARKPSEPAEE
jgi:uncharacterized membrane protein YhaH (DUF805 family)